MEYSIKKSRTTSPWGEVLGLFLRICPGPYTDDPTSDLRTVGIVFGAIAVFIEKVWSWAYWRKQWYNVAALLGLVNLGVALVCATSFGPSNSHISGYLMLPWILWVGYTGSLSVGAAGGSHSTKRAV